jgi:3-oxoacyl-[acyl-carrier-protein] synthase-1
MTGRPVAVFSVGLVTAVGLTAPSSCAAIRAKVTNPRETKFRDSGNEWIVGCPVSLDVRVNGRAKLALMAAMAVAECLESAPAAQLADIPMCLCVAERSRVGRAAGLDDQLFQDIESNLGAGFAHTSMIIPHGRVSVATALDRARDLIYEGNLAWVLIVATDSLLTWSQLRSHEQNERLLTSRNANGFIPGEAAGAILVGRPKGPNQLVCEGIGFALEKAAVDSGEPLRGDGLSSAVTQALAGSACGLHDLDFRITDVSGEHYYFKEAALVLSRVLRQRKQTFDIWHAAECTGEVGAAAGAIALAVANTACRKGYAPGPGMLLHFSNDSGERAAIVLRYGAH